MKHALVVLLLTLSSTSMFAASGAQGPNREARVAIFIGPQTRGGFVDIDSGILDSIKDVQNEFRHASEFNVVLTPEKADILLFVVGRRIAGDAGSVGVPIGTSTMFLPIKRRAIDTVLRVGSYEKANTSEAENQDQWKASAKKVLKDVMVWVQANRASLPTQPAANR